MTRISLIKCLCDETNEALKDLLLPVKPQKENPRPAPRCPEVHPMHLPDSKSYKDKAPYVIHQLITGKDFQRDGDDPESTSVIRSVFAVYAPAEDEGGLSLLNLIERLRIHLLKEIVIGKRFMLDMNEGIEMLIYPDNTAPFFAGEMSTVWKGAPIEREVHAPWRK
jgi:hypothetical protein